MSGVIGPIKRAGRTGVGGSVLGRALARHQLLVLLPQRFQRAPQSLVFRV